MPEADDNTPELLPNIGEHNEDRSDWEEACDEWKSLYNKIRISDYTDL
jgi:iron-sulfur cluster repair protein YtfE (RIC family)